MKPTLILTSIFLLAALFVAANNSLKEAVVENPDSLAEAGIRYLRNETPDYEKAFQCLRRSVDAGSTKGLGHLSRCYALGYGVEKNTDSAMFYCKKAAVAGDQRAQFTLARKYYTIAKYAVDDSVKFQRYRKAAYYWMRKAADNGNSLAMFYLGRAAYQGDTMLANLYSFCRGVEVDKAVSDSLFKEEKNIHEVFGSKQLSELHMINATHIYRVDSLKTPNIQPIRFAPPVRPVRPYVPYRVITKPKVPKIFRRLPL